MTNEQILKAITEKAIKNGWNPPDEVKFIHVPINDKENVPVFYYVVDGKLYFNHDIIFSHCFAKAFWGEEMAHIKNGCVYIPKSAADDYSRDNDPKFPIWKYFLQQMVLEEDPIKYLEKFI